jgi:hypothetical protein
LNADENEFAVNFAVSLNSLLYLRMLSCVSFPQLAFSDTDAIAEALRKIAAANPKLRYVDIKVHHRHFYKLACRFLLGNSSTKDLFPDKLDQIDELCRARLGVAWETLSICTLGLWSIFNMLAPTAQFKKAKDIAVWRRGFDSSFETVHKKLVGLSQFILRLQDPELQETKALIDPYVEEIDKIVGEIIAAERRFAPLLNTEDIACTILSWGGMMLLHHPDGAAVRQQVAEKCHSTLQNTPNLLSVCSRAHCYDFPVTWTTAPALHCVFELGEWYDPETKIVKEKFLKNLKHCHELLLAMALHPKFSPDILTEEQDSVCRFMLQSLLDSFVDPDIPSFDAGYLALAKMCASRNLKINLTKDLSPCCLQRMFVSEEMLELFSRIADNLSNLGDCSVFCSTRFRNLEQLFGGVAFMLREMEKRNDEFSPVDIIEHRTYLSHAIWKGFQEKDTSRLFSVDPTAKCFEYIFDIWPQIPSPFIPYLEEDSIQSYYYRPLIINTMYSDEKLRKYLPPAALQWVLQQNSSIDENGGSI